MPAVVSDHSALPGFSIKGVTMGIGDYFVVHAMYTSMDHAWRSYFNGAWAAGKPAMAPHIISSTTGLSSTAANVSFLLCLTCFSELIAQLL